MKTLVLLSLCLYAALAVAADPVSLTVLKLDSPIIQTRDSNSISYMTLQFDIASCNQLTVTATPALGSDGDISIAVANFPFVSGGASCPTTPAPTIPAATTAPATAAPTISPPVTAAPPATFAPTAAPTTGSPTTSAPVTSVPTSSAPAPTTSTAPAPFFHSSDSTSTVPVTCASSCRPSDSACVADPISMTGPFFAAIPNATTGTYHVALVNAGSLPSTFILTASCHYQYAAEFRTMLPSLLIASDDESWWTSSRSDRGPRMPRPDAMLQRTAVSDSEQCSLSNQEDECTAALGVYLFEQSDAVLYAPSSAHSGTGAHGRGGDRKHGAVPHGCALMLGSSTSTDLTSYTQLVAEDASTPSTSPHSSATDIFFTGSVFVATLPNGCQFTYNVQSQMPPPGVLIAFGVAALLLSLVAISCACCLCRRCPQHRQCRARANACACWPSSFRFADVDADAYTNVPASGEFHLPQFGPGTTSSVHAGPYEMHAIGVAPAGSIAPHPSVYHIPSAAALRVSASASAPAPSPASNAYAYPQLSSVNMHYYPNTAPMFSAPAGGAYAVVRGDESNL